MDLLTDYITLPFFIYNAVHSFTFVSHTTVLALASYMTLALEASGRVLLYSSHKPPSVFQLRATNDDCIHTCMSSLVCSSLHILFLAIIGGIDHS